MGPQQGGGNATTATRKKRSLTTSTKRAKKAFVTDPAVRVPHDGPIASHLMSSKSSSSKLKESSNSSTSNNNGEEVHLVGDNAAALYSPSEKAAIDVLLSIGVAKLSLAGDEQTTEPCSSSSATRIRSSIGNQVETASVKLLTELQAASDVQNQLAALRSYRSTVLHILSRGNESSNGSSADDNIADDEVNNDEATSTTGIIATYRILVELSLSADTPVAVARAVRSSLEALRTGTGQLIDCGTISTIHAEVANSILVLGDRNGSKDNATSTSTTAGSLTWSDPIFTLFQALSYDSLTCSELMASWDNAQQALNVLLNASRDIEGVITSQSFASRDSNASDDTALSSSAQHSPLEVTRAVDLGTETVSTLKLIMARLLSDIVEHGTDENIADALSSLLKGLLLPLLCCTSTSTDSLSKVGVALGQVWLYGWYCEAGNDFKDDGDGVIARCAARTITALASTESQPCSDDSSTNRWMVGLPDLNVLSPVRGISATLPDSVLLRPGSMDTSSSLLLDPIGTYLIGLCLHSTDPAVRLSAIRGLDTVLTRVVTILKNASMERDQNFLGDIEELAENALEVALGTWENSSSRQVSCAVPGLFDSLLKVIQSPGIKSLSIDAVVNRVLKQPSGRKGRYIALEALLKEKSVPGRLLEIGGGSDLIQSFLDGIGDSESNARPIADLCGRLLCVVREEMNAKAGIVDPNMTGNKKERRRREKELVRERQQGDDSKVVEVQSEFIPEWVDLWADPVANALLSPVHRRRTRVAAFCLPMLETMSGGPMRKGEMARCFSIILQRLNQCNRRNYDADRILWAKLEVVRQARNQKLTKTSVLTVILQEAIADAIPVDLVESALTHNDSTIHLAAFSTLDAIIPSYYGADETVTPLQLVSQELELWKDALPYALKCSGKEHVAQMIKCLDDVLNRASAIQSEHNHKDEGGIDSADDIVLSFCSFLINDLFVKSGSYPGTVADKESFALPLAQCILSFSCDGKILSKSNSINSVASSDSAKPRRRTRNKGITNRLLSPREVVSRERILRLLATSDVFGAILSLLHSMWDRTRELAYEFACDLINQATLASIPLPSSLLSIDGQRSWRARSCHLSSSPRQREADTGGRMLALLFTALPSNERQKFLDETANLANDRITMMGEALGVEESLGGTVNQRPLPLAYGLLHALRLMLKQNRVLTDRDGRMNGIEGLADFNCRAYEDIAVMSSRAIETSLAIVADLKKDSDEDLVDIPQDSVAPGSAAEVPKKSATPLNVNTGAIGANAVYSSIKAGDQEAEDERYALQRVIMGSWLLTKEACAALATTIVDHPSSPPAPLVENAGSLLISAMVSLKHQGAAFAAHQSLQLIALACNSHEALLCFPDQWSKRILHEISSRETVRDSTLRRSTGFALGLLSLMRTQPSLSASSRGLSQDVLAEIIRFSFPSATVMKENLQKWTASNESCKTFVFSTFLSPGKSSSSLFINDDNYEIRTRVHALNILRLAILDAPLAPVVNKIVGDAFISAIIGYSDASWRVRSSATMVYSAAMLRVVDANKNASALSMDLEGSGRTSGAAITAVELFRCYPPLARFLQVALQDGIGAETDFETIEGAMFDVGYERQSTSADHLHPALFPVLLLLSRLQPVAQSFRDSAATDLTDPFVKPVMLCLKHRHHKVRVMAARALSVLCSGDGGDDAHSLSSRSNLLSRCSALIASTMSAASRTTFNAQHGLLLGVQALLQSSASPEVLFEEETLFATVQYFASWCGGTGACPPLCTKIALEAWAHAESYRRAKSTEHVIDQRYLQAVYTAVDQMEALSADTNSAVVGAAQLGAAAGTLSCDASFSIIFSPTIDESKRALHIGNLEKLLTSKCYDVRLHAVKSFKKKIWSKIDGILSDTSVEGQKRAAFLSPVCTMLVRALRSEMERENGKGRLALHPPTLRRLSRCALDCLSAYRSLCESPSLPLGEISAEELPVWDLVMDMRELGRMEIEDEGSCAGTRLAGNAIELLALILSSVTRCPTNNNDAILNKFSDFFSALLESTDPSLYWMVRHSAAVAVGTSGILREDFLATLGGEKPALKRLRLNSYLCVLTFLQDSDEDVRNAAGRSLSSSLGPEKLVNHSAMQHLPLMELEVAYKRVGERHNDSDLILRLLSTILSECRDAQSKVDLALTEFSFSERCQDPSKLLNLSSKRKIFEAEDSNPYSEPLITCQLSASILGKSSLLRVGNKEALDVMEELTSKCSVTIGIIKARASEKVGYDKDVAHNLTWSSEIFPIFHGLLVGAIVSVHLGCRNPDTIVKAAQDLLSAFGENGQRSVHPCIFEALQVLSTASPGNDSTKDGLFKACFLVPSVCMPSS